MKKSLVSLSIVGVFLLSACGPSAEEKAAAEKARQDSIAAVEAAAAEKAYNDSVAMVTMQQQALEKARMDSIAMAEEMAKNKKGGTKPAPKPVVKEEPKKVEPTKQGSLKDKLGVDSKTEEAKKEGQEAPKKLKDKLK